MINKDLRSIAEDRMPKEETLSSENLEKLSPKEVNFIIQDLKVHQIELEMQNEELKRIQAELEDAKARYFDIYDLAPEGYLIVSEQGFVLESNLTAVNMLGLTRTGLFNQRLTKYIFYGDQEIYFMHKKRLFESLFPQEFELRMIRSDGSVLWTRLTANVVMDETVSKCRMILSDITGRKKIEEKLMESEEKFKTLVMSMDQGLALHEIILDSDGKPADYLFIDINDSYTRLLGVTREMCIGKRVKEIMPSVDQYLIDILGRVAITGEPNYYENYSETTGRYYSTYCYSPKKNQFAVLVSDIDDRVKREEKINYLSYHDQLTGIYNRRYYEEELKRLDTERNLPISIIMGDLNGLKLINDSFGHSAGDEFLVKAAEAIKQGCRANDIIARLGGDEFVILLPHTDASDTEKVIARINKLASEKKVGTLDLSVTFGYGTKTNIIEKMEDVYINAENQMYRHKLYDSASVKSRMINTIMNTLYEKNPRERLHSARVSEISVSIAERMNLADNDIRLIKIAGLMHDIGKIGIDEKILNSKEKLNSEEMKEIQRHPDVSYRILISCSEFSDIAVVILEHHERWDGKGYPKGLQGKSISLPARIIAVADSFDVMTNERPYKKALSEKDAIEEILRCSGTQFDPEIAEIFVSGFIKAL